MSWGRVHQPVRCWFCPESAPPIPSGAWARVGDSTPGVWCVDHADRNLGEHPPLDEGTRVVEPSSSPEAEPQPALFEDLDAGRYRSGEARRELTRLRDVFERPAEDAR